jgi:hypothetical protein
MTTKTNWSKLYLAFEADRESLKANGKEYGHHSIRIGYAYDYPGKSKNEPHFWSASYSVNYQITASPNSELRFDAYAYSGELNCRIEDAVAAGKLIAKVNAKAEELAPNEPCPYKRFLVGLRGLGYRQPNLTNGGSEIIDTH